MSDHIHNWNPIDGECGQYACVCGVTGYRSRAGIVPHREQRAQRQRNTVGRKSGVTMSDQFAGNLGHRRLGGFRHRGG